METADIDKTYRLVVTGPARERLYERFRRLFYGRDDVEVVCDRREGERRWSDGRVTPERRTHERRHQVTWVVPPE